MTALRLNLNPIGEAGARALAGSSSLGAVTELGLGSCGVGIAGALAVLESPHLARLTDLNLSDSGFGPDGAAALARSPGLARLARLYVDSNGLGPEGTRALASAAGLTNLAVLHLGNFDLVGQALAARGYRVTVPVERIRPEVLFDMLTNQRRKHGIRLVPAENALAVGLTAIDDQSHLLPLLPP